MPSQQKEENGDLHQDHALDRMSDGQMTPATVADSELNSLEVEAPTSPRQRSESKSDTSQRGVIEAVEAWLEKTEFLPLDEFSEPIEEPKPNSYVTAPCEQKEPPSRPKPDSSGSCCKHRASSKPDKPRTCPQRATGHETGQATHLKENQTLSAGGNSESNVHNKAIQAWRLRYKRRKTLTMRMMEKAQRDRKMREMLNTKKVEKDPSGPSE
ncbi:hypothetical protein GGS21DRAFT_489937 [Xylaria nigripes]|nr:hypothetical protein GGS21DRAFT_489937 [Xylaria nigripes]